MRLRDRPRRAALAVAAAFICAGVAAPVVAPARAESGELLYAPENNRLRRVDVDTIGTASVLQDVFIASHDDTPGGTDINGQVCPFHDGSGRFVTAEDTNQQHPPAGWGVFAADGHQVGKLSATYFTDGPEPHGCAIDADGRLFTSEVGFQGYGPRNGQLLLWFPPYDVFPGPPGAYPATDERSTSYCKLAEDLGTTGAVAVDAQGRVYVAESSGARIDRFSPPFPTGTDAAHGCGKVDPLGSPLATEVHREVFQQLDLPNFLRGMWTFAGVAVAPNGNVYLSSVATGRIAEYRPDGTFVRMIVRPPQFLFPTYTGSPEDLTVGPDGTIYYADMDLRWGTFPDLFPGPGPNGKLRRVRFDAHGTPQWPEVIIDHLDFPDGVAILPGDLQGS